MLENATETSAPPQRQARERERSWTDRGSKAASATVTGLLARCLLSCRLLILAERSSRRRSFSGGRWGMLSTLSFARRMGGSTGAVCIRAMMLFTA